MLHQTPEINLKRLPFHDDSYTMSNVKPLFVMKPSLITTDNIKRSLLCTAARTHNAM